MPCKCKRTPNSSRCVRCSCVRAGTPCTSACNCEQKCANVEFSPRAAPAAAPAADIAQSTYELQRAHESTDSADRSGASSSAFNSRSVGGALSLQSGDQFDSGLHHGSTGVVVPLDAEVRGKGVKALEKEFSMGQLESFWGKTSPPNRQVGSRLGGTGWLVSSVQRAEKAHNEYLQRLAEQREEKERREEEQELARRSLPQHQPSTSLIGKRPSSSTNETQDKDNTTDSTGDAGLASAEVTVNLCFVTQGLPDNVTLVLELEDPLLSKGNDSVLVWVPLHRLPLQEGNRVAWHEQLTLPVTVRELKHCTVYAVFQAQRVSDSVFQSIRVDAGTPHFEAVVLRALPPLKRIERRGLLEKFGSWLTGSNASDVDVDVDSMPQWRSISVVDPFSAFIEASILLDRPLVALAYLSRFHQRPRKINAEHAVMLLNALDPKRIDRLSSRGFTYVLESCRELLHLLNRPLFAFAPALGRSDSEHKPRLLSQPAESISPIDYARGVESEQLGHVALRLAPSLAHALQVAARQPSLANFLCQRNWSILDNNRRVDVLRVLLDVVTDDVDVKTVASQCAASRDYFIPANHDTNLVLQVVKSFLLPNAGVDNIANFALQWLTSSARSVPKGDDAASVAMDLDLLAVIGSSGAVSPQRISNAASRWLQQRVLVSASSSSWFFWRSSQNGPADILASQLRTCQILTNKLSSQNLIPQETGVGGFTVFATLQDAMKSFLASLSDPYIVQYGHVAWAIVDAEPENTAAQAAQFRTRQALKTLVDRGDLAQAARLLVSWPRLPPSDFVTHLVDASGFDDTRPISSFFLSADSLIESLHELKATEHSKVFANTLKAAQRALSDVLLSIPLSELRPLLREGRRQISSLSSRASLLNIRDYTGQMKTAQQSLYDCELVADVCRFLADRTGDTETRDAVEEALRLDQTLGAVQKQLPDFERILNFRTTRGRLDELMKHRGWWRDEIPRSVTGLVTCLIKSQERWLELRAQGKLLTLAAGTVLDLFQTADDVSRLFDLDFCPPEETSNPDPATLTALKTPFKVKRVSRLLPALLRLPQRVGADDDVVNRGSDVAAARLAAHAERLENVATWHKDSCSELHHLLTGDVYNALKPLDGSPGEDALEWLAVDGKAEILLNFLKDHPDRSAFDNLKDLVDDGDDADDAIESIQRAWQQTHRLLSLAQDDACEWRSLLTEIASMARKNTNLLRDLKQASDFVPEVQNIMHRLNEETGARAIEDFRNVWHGLEPLIVTAAGYFSIGKRSSNDLRDLRNRLVLSGRGRTANVDPIDNDLAAERIQTEEFVQLITDVEGVSAAFFELYQSGHPQYDLDRTRTFTKPLQVAKVRRYGTQLREKLVVFRVELDAAFKTNYHLNLLPLEYLRSLFQLMSNFESSGRLVVDSSLRCALTVFLRLNRGVSDGDIGQAFSNMTDVDSDSRDASSIILRLGSFLQALVSIIGANSRRRLSQRPANGFIRGFDAGKPLLLTTQEADIISLVVILFGQEARAPEIDEILICRSTTTFHEVREMIQRATLNTDSNDNFAMFVVAGIHLLSDAVQEDVVRWLHEINLLSDDAHDVSTSSRRKNTENLRSTPPSRCNRRLIFVCEERLSTTGMLAGSLRAFSQKAEIDRGARDSARPLIQNMIAVRDVEVLNARAGCYGKTHHVERLERHGSPVAVISVTHNVGPARMIRMLERVLEQGRQGAAAATLGPIHIKLASGVDVEQFGTIAFELLIVGVLVAPRRLFDARERLVGRPVFLEVPNFDPLDEKSRHVLTLFPCPNLVTCPRHLIDDDDWHLVAGAFALAPNGIRALNEEKLQLETLKQRAPHDDAGIVRLVESAMAATEVSFLQQVIFVRYVASALRVFCGSPHLSMWFEPESRNDIKQRRGDVLEMARDAGRELIRPAQYSDGRVEFADGQLWSSSTPFLVMITESSVVPIMRRDGQCPQSVTRLLQSDAARAGTRGSSAVNFMALRDPNDMLSNLLQTIGLNSDLTSDPGQRLLTRIGPLNFSLTRENCLKSVACLARLRARIPVVLCGATGIGKTALVRFLAALHDDVQFYSLTIHGGTTERSLGEWLSDVVIHSQRHPNELFWVFLDECNAAPITAAIKEVVCDHRLPDGRRLPENVRVLAALNPYIDRSKRDTQAETGTTAHKSDPYLQSTDRHHVHFSSARMRQGPPQRAASVFEHEGAEQNGDEDYEIATERIMDEGDMANLVYRVAPIPASLGELVWDFGDLSEEDEKVFVLRMVEAVPSVLRRPLSEGILEAHSFIREHCAHEPALIVSLRDVKRCSTILRWLNLDLLPKISSCGNYRAAGLAPHQLRSVFHTLMTAYISRLDVGRRGGLLQRIAARLGVASQEIEEIVDQDRQIFATTMLEGHSGIAQNTALRENLFVLTTCIMSRIPIFLVGRPGSSKTLAMRIIEDKLRALRKHRPFGMPAIEISSYQCSPLSTGQSILGAANRVAAAVKRHQQQTEERRHVLLLDEVGLAEESPFMPLKVLHELLERTSEFSIVGISNWALDPAKMNRALFLNRGSPSEDDLCETARSLAESASLNDADSNSLRTVSELDLRWRRALARGFDQACAGSPANFFGLRDFYSLVKIFIDVRSHGAAVNDIAALEYAVARAFGGLPQRASHARSCFAEEAPVEHVQLAPRKPLDLIKDNLVSETARHLLIVSPDEDSALDLLMEFSVLSSQDGVAFEPFIGSEFDGDISATAIAVDIGRIKHCVEVGVPIVLLRGDALFEALYDLLNQHYVSRGEKLYAQLALGAERRMCAVHPAFKCIVLMGERIVADGKVPPPLLNRFEKTYLSQFDVLTSEAEQVLVDVQKRLSTLLGLGNEYSLNDSKFLSACKGLFVGFSPDNVQSLVRKHTRAAFKSETLAADSVLEDVLLTALPEAILSLSESTQADWARTVYFTKQELDHKNFPEAVTRLRDRRADRHLVFTFSAPVVLRDLAPRDARVLDLDSFSTEALFRAAVTRYLGYLGEDGLLIIQCRFQERSRLLDGGAGNNVMIRAGRLLSQIQHVTDSEANAADSRRRVVLVIHLLPGTCHLDQFFCRHGSRWSASTIADLEAGVQFVDPLWGLPQLQNVKGRSRASLVDSSGICALLLAGELRLAVNQVHYPRVGEVSAEKRLSALSSILHRPRSRAVFLAAVERAMALHEQTSSIAREESWLREALSPEAIESVGSARRSVGLAVLKLLRESTCDALLLLDQHLNLLSLESELDELDVAFRELVDILYGSTNASSLSSACSMFERFPWPRRSRAIVCGRGQPFVPRFPFSATLHDALLQLSSQTIESELESDAQEQLRHYAETRFFSSRAIERFAGDFGMLVGLPAVDATIRVSRAVSFGSRTLSEAANCIADDMDFLQDLLGLCQVKPELEPAVVAVCDRNEQWVLRIANLIEAMLRELADAAHTVIGSQNFGSVRRLIGRITVCLDTKLAYQEHDVALSSQAGPHRSLRDIFVGVCLYRDFIGFVAWDGLNSLSLDELIRARTLLLQADYSSLHHALDPVRVLCSTVKTSSPDALRRFLAASLLTLSENNIIHRGDLGSAARLFAFSTETGIRNSPAAKSAYATAVRAVVVASDGDVDLLINTLADSNGTQLGPELSHEIVYALRAIHSTAMLEAHEKWQATLSSWDDHLLTTGNPWDSIVHYSRLVAAIDATIDHARTPNHAATNEFLRDTLRKTPFLRLRALCGLLRRCGSAAALCRLWKARTGWLADVPVLEEQAHPLAVVESGPGEFDRARRVLSGPAEEAASSASSLMKADLALAVAAELWNPAGVSSQAIDATAIRTLFGNIQGTFAFGWVSSLGNLQALLHDELAIVYSGLISAVAASGSPARQGRSWFQEMLTRNDLPMDTVYFVSMDDDEDAAAAAMLLATEGITKVWRCSNGHPYGIDRCGMPMEVGTCPRCGVLIGGTGHTPVGTTFQGASRPANIPSGYVFRSDIQADSRSSIRALPSLQFRVTRFLLHALFLARACSGNVMPKFGGGDAVSFFAERLKEDFKALQHLLGAFELRSEDSVRDVLLTIARRLQEHAADATALAQTPDERTRQENWLRKEIIDAVVSQDGVASAVAVRNSLNSLRRHRAESGGLSAGLRRVLGEPASAGTRDLFEPPRSLSRLRWWKSAMDSEPVYGSARLTWERVSAEISLRAVPSGHRSVESETAIPDADQSDQTDTTADSESNSGTIGGQILEENSAIPFPILRMISDEMCGRGRQGRPNMDAVDHLYNLLNWRAIAVSRFSGHLIEGRRDLSVQSVLRRDPQSDMRDRFSRFRASWTALAGGELPHVRAQCREVATKDFPIVTDDLSLVDTVGIPADEGADIGLPEVIYIATKTLAESYNDFLDLGSAVLAPETPFRPDAELKEGGESCEFGSPIPRLRWSQVANHRDLLFERLDDSWLSNPFRSALLFDDSRDQIDLEAMERAAVGALFEGRARIEPDAKVEHGEGFTYLKVHERLSVSDQMVIEERCKESRSAWDKLFAFADALVGWSTTAAADPAEVKLLQGSIGKALQFSHGLRDTVRAALRPWADACASSNSNDANDQLASGEDSPAYWPQITMLSVLYARALRTLAENASAKDVPINVEQLTDLPYKPEITTFVRSLTSGQLLETRQLLNFVLSDPSASPYLLSNQMGLFEVMAIGSDNFDQNLRDLFEELDTKTQNSIRVSLVEAFRHVLLAHATADSDAASSQRERTTELAEQAVRLSDAELSDLSFKRATESTLPFFAKRFKTCRVCGHFIAYSGGSMHMKCSKCGSCWYWCCLRIYHHSLQDSDIQHLRDSTCDQARQECVDDSESDKVHAVEEQLRMMDDAIAQGNGDSTARDELSAESLQAKEARGALPN